MTDELPLALPGWLDWRWALRRLEAGVMLPGEAVRPEDGVVRTALRAAGGPQVARVHLAGGRLCLTPGEQGLAEWAEGRFHLGLDAGEVALSLERAGLEPLGPCLRRPAAAGLWPFCLMFLCGGDLDAPHSRAIYAELGAGADDLHAAPEPEDVLRAGGRRLVRLGVAPHRAENVVGLAQAFAQRLEWYDEQKLRALPAEDAVHRLRALPHIGEVRARSIACDALGHDDILIDFSRREGDLRRYLGLGWAQLRSRAEGAAPYRSVVSDLVREAIDDPEQARGSPRGTDL